MMTMNFNGRAKRLDDIDLPKLGALIGVGEDEIHAFLDVETRGGGFDKNGRPKMLFEPHVFYRHLSGSNRVAAVKAGLAYPKWGTAPYPRDSYPRLMSAIEINETAALKSSSWGIGQILGQNYQLAGYSSVQAMVRAFTKDEELQLKAAIDFIKSESLDDDLRERRWQGFARGYNGPGYARHGYDKKLAAAFAKWSKIRDTPYDPAPTMPPVIPDIYPAVDVSDLAKKPTPILNIIGGILEWIVNILSRKA